MDKEYTMATFLSRFIISVMCLIIGLPCFFLGIVGENEAFPFLRLLHIMPMPENMSGSEVFYFTLGVMAFLATVILLIMMFGWIFDISTNRFLKILVLIGFCCGFPNTVLCLSFSDLLGIGLLILPATILSIYLSLWYFNIYDKTQFKDKINNL